MDTSPHANIWTLLHMQTYGHLSICKHMDTSPYANSATPLQRPPLHAAGTQARSQVSTSSFFLSGVDRRPPELRLPYSRTIRSVNSVVILYASGLKSSRRTKESVGLQHLRADSAEEVAHTGGPNSSHRRTFQNSPKHSNKISQACLNILSCLQNAAESHTK